MALNKVNDNAISKEENNLERQLHKIANWADKLNPSLSRYYRLMGKELSSSRGPTLDEPIKEISTCKYCGAPLDITSHSVKLQPRRRFTPHISRLLKKYDGNPRSLGFYQQKLLKDYKDSQNQLRVKCFTCQKTCNIPGQSCTDRLKQKKTLIKVQPVEEKVRTKKQMRKDKKKARRKERNQQAISEEVNAGLKIDSNRKVPELQTSTSKQDEQSRPSIKHDSKKMSSKHTDTISTVTSFKDDRKKTSKEHTNAIDTSLNTKKGTAETKLELIDKMKSTKSSSLNVMQDQKKKKRFASQLSNILKQEKAKEKKKESSRNDGKLDLKAFLTSL